MVGPRKNIKSQTQRDQKFGVFPETDGNSGDSETRDAELLDLIM